jgi:hypothetical protein
MADAACRNLRPTQADKLFFAAGTPPREAIDMCLSCPVIARCGQFADRVERGAAYTYGVWAGTSPKQRRSA